jgi:hypothetical protein
MKIKTYRTRELKGFSVHKTIDGKLVSVIFKRGCTLGSTSSYTTSDEKIQNMLESLNSFGSDFYISEQHTVEEAAPVEDVKPKVKPETEPVKEEEIEVVDILDAQTFKNLVELRNALQEKGIDVSQITNVKAAESIAKKNGYNYTVEKNS